MLILAVLVLRARNASRRSYPVVGVPSLSPGASAKSASNGGTAYTPVPKGDADDLLTKITFHDLTSEDEL